MKQQMLENAVDTLLSVIHRFAIADKLTQSDLNKLKHIQAMRDPIITKETGE